ncbi:MAG: laccase domain-containing protein, partial [Dechloromonas sp.]|nr:laccase domain-containing protein [Dechloromonas sp.]
EAFVPSSPGKWLADIYLLAKHRLRAAGLTSIHGGGLCTVSDGERYFSYRRDGVTGRMATLIWLAADGV